MKLEARLQRVELILSDVDGVLTDGGLFYDAHGSETKKFHVRDGLGIKLWQRAGFKFGLVTARTSNIVRMRANELGLDLVRQGHENKLPIVEQILAEFEYSPEQLCFIGDDLTDLACLQYAGVGATVADAAHELREEADFVTSLPGGRGAVRELVETLLKSQQRWQELVRRYYLPRRT
jgi:3-deoxy-D-manno-octulosonate 8-phosphate phosphatase (KDO 8-P phosphatase)